MIGASGVAFTSPCELWQQTNSLAFITIDNKRMLHQLWTSNTGRTEWKLIPEIAPSFAETGRA